MKEDNRIQPKTAIPMDQLMKLYISSMGLTSSMNTQRIFKAWDEASGAAAYTVRRYFRDGTLYITLGSSVVRNQLGFQKELLLEKINGILVQDDLFVKDDPKVSYVQTLVLK